MSNLYLLQYNPYSNRQVKGFADISSYEPYVVGVFEAINFNPQDNVSATQIVNTQVSDADYLVVTTEVSPVTIESRWFILESERMRNGQYKLTLRRDVIYDHLEEIVSSTCYIEKGYVNKNNPAIYNKENLEVNQIKKEEVLLEDITRTPWIVGYLGKTTEATTVTRKNIYPEAVTLTASEYDLLSHNTVLYDKVTSEGYKFTMPSGGRKSANAFYVIHFNAFGNLPITTKFSSSGTWSTKSIGGEMVSSVDMQNLSQQLSELNVQEIYDAEARSSWTKLYEDYEHFKNKIVSYDNKYYKCTFIARTTVKQETLATTSLTRISLYNELRTNDLVVYKPQQMSDAPVEVSYNVIFYTPKLDEIVDEYSATIPATANRVNLNNQPYSMFAMPYYDFQAGGAEIVFQELQGQASLSIAQAISETFSGSNALYDLQLVPYCPILQYVDTYELTSFVWIDDMPTGSYTPITHTTGGTEETVGYIFWCADDSFTFDINFEIEVPDDPIEFKVENQAKMYRLNSPNYSGTFEFSATRNNGVGKFNVDCTYKPYSPYIHINPDFGGLYGQDYNDARGLICGGDFSLPQINNAWETYQIQNKNYNNSFNREIETIEKTNEYAMWSDVITAGVGTVQGAMTGSYLGEAGGSKLAGGIVGGVASAGAGLADVAINIKLRELQLDLKKDQFNFSLQNIQALPNTLTKVGALNANNKLFPFLEMYECTDIEKEAIRNKIIYNGMSIYQIGEIENFIAPGSYLKAKLIRTGLHDDFHMLETIKDELESGVYFE